MTRLTAALAALTTATVTTATVAEAHSGPHLHPHGGEHWFLIATLAVLAAAAVYAARR